MSAMSRISPVGTSGDEQSRVARRTARTVERASGLAEAVHRAAPGRIHVAEGWSVNCSCARLMRVLAATVSLAGCGYQSGSFESPVREFSGSLITVECLDLAIDRRPDLPDGHAVVSYTFGNRCDHPVLVDLSQVAVLGRDADGRSFA